MTRLMRARRRRDQEAREEIRNLLEEFVRKTVEVACLGEPRVEEKRMKRKETERKEMEADNKEAERK